ncbi:MAG: PorP/SprF family type IX secretion system membrane protein [Candidatus Pseudobacter hemicellulosilyticus]|uniref:PorP/SprF family type IX secretion system membrane protein n=1 Tax=Candidatus Pseudobacter hemicellulosilyticus TaxID=3121375 RepID=A0AAJ5WWX2_9BACT|nr:MAG: PorP/SprF family type IX secretion system membrane protein [Pseudobacter sp.]
MLVQRSKNSKGLYLLAGLLACLAVVPVRAQDLHFSQWFNSPLSTNPANTGFIPDADYRIGANYRNQWSSIMSEPYRTMSIWGDAQLFRDQIASGWLGVGGLILHDKAGSGGLTSTKVYGSVAYHQMLGVAHLLSAGFNIGWANKRINTSALKFPDQFDGRFFDGNLPTSVVIDNPSINYFDVQMGVNYAFFPTDKIYINGGVSAWHINRPRESFFALDAANYEESRIPMRYTAFANASIKLSEWVIVNPMVYYSQQAKTEELVGGINAQYNLSGDGEMQVMGGLYYRPGDAFIPMIGFQYKNIRLTFTYDATTSALKNYNNGRGAYEFALMTNGFYDEWGSEKRQALCPTF